MEEDLPTARKVILLRSRHFQNWRSSLSFDDMYAPPEHPAVQVVMAAFEPLFRAYAAMPFSVRILTPLLAATMDRLLPEMYGRLLDLGRDYNRPRSRLIPMRPTYTNVFVQGEVALQHMDRIEAAFRHARESGDLVSLEQGRVVRREPDSDLFLNPADFRTSLHRNRPLTNEPLARAIHEHAQEVERAMAWAWTDFMVGENDFPGWSKEVLARAKETLVHCLNPVQRAEFERVNRFSVVAQDGQIYEVLPTGTFNVRRHPWLYCCQPIENVCLYDRMLASKLWLEAEFERFMRIANRRHLHTGQVINGREEADVFLRGRMRGPMRGGAGIVAGFAGP